MTENKSVLTRLRRFVDGEADTPFEYFMLLSSSLDNKLFFINTVFPSSSEYLEYYN